MPLTSKQQKRVDAASGPRKASMRAAFLRQNAGSKTGNAEGMAPGKGKGNKSTPNRRLPPPAGQALVSPSQPRRIPNYLDPMCPCPAPTVTSDGRALPYTGLDSYDFQVDTTNYTVLLATNTGDSGTVGAVFKVNVNGGYISNSMRTLTIPALAAADNAGGASSSRAMKFSVSVVNCTNNLKRGGRVTYINSAQRLPTMRTDVATEFIDVIDGIKASPYRRRINGTDLVTPKQLIGFPVDGTVYRQFVGHQGTLSHIELFGRIMAAGPSITPEPRPMSAVAYIFDPATDEQDYSVTIRAAYYTRWPITSVPGQKMEAIPTADPHFVNAVHDHVESTANEMVHVAEGGALATVLPKVANAVRTYAPNVFGRAGAALEAALPEVPAAAEAFAPLLL